MNDKEIVLIIILSSFLLLFLLLFLSFINSTSYPSCNFGRVSNLYSLTSKEGEVTYIPGYEVCHLPNRCNNGLAPCVYDPQTGTNCPSDESYTGEIPAGPLYACLNRVVCPPWSTTGFTEYGGYFVQTQSQPGTCGISGDYIDRLWPATCIVGQLTYNLTDSKYYCSNSTLSCSPGERLVVDWDKVKERSTFSCQ